MSLQLDHDLGVLLHDVVEVIEGVLGIHLIVHEEGRLIERIADLGQFDRHFFTFDLDRLKFGLVIEDAGFFVSHCRDLPRCGQVFILVHFDAISIPFLQDPPSPLFIEADHSVLIRHSRHGRAIGTRDLYVRTVHRGPGFLVQSMDDEREFDRGNAKAVDIILATSPFITLRVQP